MDVNGSDDLDLTPRTSGDAAGAAAGRAGSRGGRRWIGVVVLVVVLAIGGFAVASALGDASLYFHNVDEAVDQRDELGTSRFNIQGIVEPGTVEDVPGGVSFRISFNGVEAEVDHTGDPVELFDDDIPVVLEGHWSGTGDDAVFLSDRMLVKHDENYEAENTERLDDAEDGYRG